MDRAKIENKKNSFTKSTLFTELYFPYFFKAFQRGVTMNQRFLFTVFGPFVSQPQGDLAAFPPLLFLPPP